VGIDAPITSRLLVGASFLYGRNVVDLDNGHAGAARIKSPLAAAYGSYSSAGNNRTGWQLRGLVGYAMPTISSDRYVTLGDDTSIASSKHGGREWSAAGEAEVSRNMRYFRLHGMFGLRASRLVEDGYTESGSLADLEIAGRTTQALTSNVGARVLVPTYHNEGMFDVHAVWSRQLASQQSDLSGRFATATSGTRFTAKGVPLARDALALGAGFSGKLKRNLSLYGDYSVELRGAGQIQRTAFAGMRLVW
jgi:outer membrane autotransporter protein